MAGGIDAQQRAPGQVDLVAVFGHHHALRRHRHQLTVVLGKHFLTVDADGAGGQPCRIDQMRRGARMGDQACIGQVLHQGAGAAGVVQVGVGGDQPVHLGRCQPGLLQRGQQHRHAVVGAAVDEGAAAVFHHKVGRVETWPHVTSVDGVDAVFGHVPSCASCDTGLHPSQPPTAPRSGFGRRRR